MSYMTDAIERVMTESVSGARCALVWLDRYQDGGAWGVHLVINTGSGWTDHRIIGLFGAADFYHGLGAYVENYCDTSDQDFKWWDDFAAGPWAPSELPDVFGTRDWETGRSDRKALQDYIRRFCIPLEWKSMGDRDLSGLIGIAEGRVNWGSLESWGVIDSGIGFDGRSTIGQVS